MGASSSKQLPPNKARMSALRTSSAWRSHAEGCSNLLSSAEHHEQKPAGGERLLVKDGAARTRGGLMCTLCWGRCARLSCAGSGASAAFLQEWSRVFFSPATFENAPPENSGLSELGAFSRQDSSRRCHKSDFRNLAKFQEHFSLFTPFCSWSCDFRI